VLIRQKKIIFEKNQTIYQNAEFCADFKTVEKVSKKFTHKKLLTKM
jgi:hypothetical protein